MQEDYYTRTTPFIHILTALPPNSGDAGLPSTEATPSKQALFAHVSLHHFCYRLSHLFRNEGQSHWLHIPRNPSQAVFSCQAHSMGPSVKI